MKYQAPKGVFDIIPFEPKPEDKWRESRRWAYLEGVLRETATQYGYQEIRTPIFESTDLFIRGVGESSDIVSKEMYTFSDRAERSMTLRPEGTASVVRSFIENHLHQHPGIHKFFYIGPMFRYERQQAGRYRQHHQFGAESVGIGRPEQDVELIDMLCQIYRKLGLANLNVLINSVGDLDSRTAYKQALATFLTPHFETLSPESQARFSKNILRILDSKDPKDREILKEAPQLLDYLTPESKSHFERVLSLLNSLKISHTVEPKLVRGLDYYNHTVFEITSEQLGAQQSLGGGGRYDGLIQSLGGPNLPSVGFATGLERILQTMLKQDAPFPTQNHPLVFLIPIGESALSKAFEMTCLIRHSGLSAEIDLSGKKVQNGLQLANHLQAEYALILVEEEIAKNCAKLKKMATREEIEVNLSNIIQKLQSLTSSYV
ncbi:MAG: histidine--tRNA ligase [Chlamydiales bacterium]|nr:histidine--tRNA ligase [Chlamydiales bacterium]